MDVAPAEAPKQTEANPTTAPKTPTTFPRKEPDPNKRGLHLLWKIELANGALFNGAEATRLLPVAERLIAGTEATEEEIVAAYCLKRDQKRERGQAYDFAWLAQDINKLLPLVRKSTALAVSTPQVASGLDRTMAENERFLEELYTRYPASDSTAYSLASN